MRFYSDRKILLPALAIACLMHFSICAVALPPELWVVNEASRDISIIDDISDTPATIETIPLGANVDADPYGIAFSTLSSDPGGHVFVTQGRHIRVIEHATRVIESTCDVGLWLGVDAVILKGADSARPELFDNDTGVPVERSYLHVAANVRQTATEPFEPWFIVLDQFKLTDLSVPCGNAVVAAGPLAPAGAAFLDAMEARVLGSPAGKKTQRAWYSYRELADPPALHSGLVVGGPELTSPWLVSEHVAFPGPPGFVVPESIHPGSPHSRELPLLTDSSAGDLVSLETGKRCPLGDVPRAVSVTGPGLASYDIWTIKLAPGGGPGMLQLSHWETCSVEPPLTVGMDPVDIDTLGRVEWQEVYVANRGSDTISVVQASAPDVVITIELGGTEDPCERCPRSLAVEERPETVCRAVNYRQELINNKTEILHTWDGIGCLDLETFKMWCRCLAQDPLDCPDYCVPPPRTGEIWCEVDIIGGDPGGGGSTITSSQGNGATQTNVEPNDDQGS